MAQPEETAERTILHVDMDAFYASVEQRRNPDLRGKPVIVGGSGNRGVVAAASYEARAFGVRSAMPSMRAKTLCPHAIFIPGDHRHYGKVSERIMAILTAVTPLVEPLSLDEAFLDVTGARRLYGDGEVIAHLIRERIVEQEELTCSVGVAPNKFLAKLATEHGKPKASPRGPIPGTGVTVIRRGEEMEFLRPLPVGDLWGVGPKTGERLSRLGIRTVADLESMPLDVLTRAVGDAHGRHLHALAHAEDDRPVVSDSQAKSIGHEETFAEDVDQRRELGVHVVRMADAVAARVRRHGVAGRTVSIKVRFGDFTTITRSVTLRQPVETETAIAQAAVRLLDEVDVDRGVRLFGVTLSNLVAEAPLQLSLDDLAGPGVGPDGGETAGDQAGWRAVSEVIDAVRDRFGEDSVMPAVLASGSDRRQRPGRFHPGQQQWGPNEAEPGDD